MNVQYVDAAVVMSPWSRWYALDDRLRQAPRVQMGDGGEGLGRVRETRSRYGSTAT